jgi:hypothetical protein
VLLARVWLSASDEYCAPMQCACLFFLSIQIKRAVVVATMSAVFASFWCAVFHYKMLPHANYDTVIFWGK